MHHQEHDNEKSYQVGMMREIVLGATRTLVWSGEDGDIAKAWTFVPESRTGA
ncbi:hypothetical protein DL98DRAFT_439893 [Cadophora sp. DSE1049]|nr:hypothetical protein DL98DRAFT_439893 [Cadophora sp. DSE1049]